MRASALEYLGCPRCGSRLESGPGEVLEGMLHCPRCGADYPVISGIPILWEDPAGYLAERRTLAGRLYRSARTPGVRGFVRRALSGPRPAGDRAASEERWVRIYLDSRRSGFYSAVRRVLCSLPRGRAAVEYGCSIGTAARAAAGVCDTVIGVDRSLAALLEARRSAPANVEYVAADALSRVLCGARFDLALALNVLEIIEPAELLRAMSRQVRRGTLVISDPYDYERGAASVRGRPDERGLREAVEELGFGVTPGTRAPSYLPWSLRIGPRTVLNYRADLVVATRG